MLSEHINSASIIAKLQSQPGNSGKFRAETIERTSGPYGSIYSAEKPIPKFKIPQEGTEPGNAYQFIHDELLLDGRPNLNLASFVSTYIQGDAQKLALENLTKNLADSDEYPALMTMHERCVSIISHLWNIQKNETAVGSATTGSSEAIHLGGLAMKRRWEARQKKNNRPFHKPNIIMGANAQVALEKFARYFDVEDRVLPVSAKSNYVLDLDLIEENVDENTIGIFVILGSTYNGVYEDVEGVSKILDKIQAEKGWDIPIHVDGASGAFVAPFVHPSVVWDFRLPRVKSINTSGHKFGLTTAGLGWIIWRSKEYLPQNLVFELRYLGGIEESYTLNFSRPGYQVLHQYFNLVHLGFKGYKHLHEGSLANARLFSKFLEATGYFTCVSLIHHPLDKQVSSQASEQLTGEEYVAGLPVVAFRFSDEFKAKNPEIPQAAISNMLRVRGYIIPNYPLPPNEAKTEVLRVVVRDTVSLDVLDRLMEDIVIAVERLISVGDDVLKLVKNPESLYKSLEELMGGNPIVPEKEEDWEDDSKGRHWGTC
ncbi:glutamate decarboxylase [Nadsonia fulvescens var. elongata DSM 6958]|uniref:Glutamate decarboxylase n=1 Tax=Nadsonia fulvescens var. elongata DSM 6958 TaxID=857566 RepID=A0A1E3PL64_9ASCO|nr:glutamate decarboxylase [Nadsonia fulvescens var. elongata DSM 6958]